MNSPLSEGGTQRRVHSYFTQICSKSKSNLKEKMKKISLFFSLLLFSACDVWSVTPRPLPVWTAIATPTPFVWTATARIIFPTLSSLPTATFPTVPPSIPAVLSSTPPTPPADTPTPSPTPTAVVLTSTPFQSVEVNILGCSTGFDLSHGMGEVTNAYVTIANRGNVDLPNVCALLRASDEGRPHPDKIRCVDSLPVGYQVTQKLTVDSAFRQDTAIQVDVSSNDILLMRVDQLACRNLEIGGVIPPDLGVVKPISP